MTDRADPTSDPSATKGKDHLERVAPTVIGAVVGGLAGRALGGMFFGHLGGTVGMVAGAVFGGKKARELADDSAGFNPWRASDGGA